jgi:hypothetical protein
MKPFTNKHSIAAGSPFHMGGSKKSPLYQDDLRAGEKIEGRPTTEVSKTGDVFKGLTTTVKTTQPVVRTEEGDRAYAAKSQKEKDIQDAEYKRNMTSTRTVFEHGLQPLTTKGPSSDFKINEAKLKEELDPVQKFKYTKERGGSQYGQGTSSGSTGYVFDEKGIKNVLNTGTYVKLEGVRKSGEKFDVYQRGKSTGLASETTVKEDLAKGRKQASADRSAKAKADILAKRKQKPIIKDKREG